jgi:hypothetical protein
MSEDASNNQQPSSDGRTPSRGSARSRAGCLTCRARKLKCRGYSGASGTCTSCARLGIDCVPSNGTSLSQGEREKLLQEAARDGSNITQAGLARLRTAASCRPCKVRRRKCSGDRPACSQCKQRNQDCVYEERRAIASSQDLQHAGADGDSCVDTTSITESEDALRSFNGGDTEIIHSLVAMYFQEISPLRCW